MPEIINWVKRKQTYFYIDSEKVSYPALICTCNSMCLHNHNLVSVGIASAIISGLIIKAMLQRMIQEVKHGMARASPATKV